MQLQYDPQQRLCLIADDKQHKPFFIDFTAGKIAHRLQQGVGKRQPLARACGIKKDFSPTILDATAGLGRDGFMLACCGCQVTMLERNVTLFQLLQDALQRAAQDEQLQLVTQRINLFNQDANDFLQTAEVQPDVIYPDVIYLDPMYPESKKSALVKQEMRIVRSIVGDDLDVEATFELALTKAKSRVVVKRHRHAEPIANRPPHHQILGKSTRFDVYQP